MAQSEVPAPGGRLGPGGRPAPGAGGDPPGRARVHPLVERAAAYAWRLLVIAAALVAVLWLTGRLLIVAIPVAVAVLLTRALTPVRDWMTRRRLPAGLAALATLLLFLLVLAGVLGAAGALMANEVEDLGPTLDAGIADIERWLVEDSPFDVSAGDVQRWRTQAGDALRGFFGSDQGAIAARAVLAGELVVGVILTLVVTFFLLKDGHRLMRFTTGHAGRRSEDVAAAAQRAWAALGGYLRGAALLGLLEGVIVGVTLSAVGAELAVPVALITFVFAFVPIVGAITAGVVAVLVALATAGFTAAVITAIVVVIVQQLDNDLLAPIIYGRALQLHPLVVLLGIGAGGALFGFVGTVFAVPVLAVIINVSDELRSRRPPGPDRERLLAPGEPADGLPGAGGAQPSRPPAGAEAPR
jgi:predicted PurR-regulated permease PerM